MKWVRNRLTRQADFHHVTHPKRGSKFGGRFRLRRDFQPKKRDYAFRTIARGLSPPKRSFPSSLVGPTHISPHSPSWDITYRSYSGRSCRPSFFGRNSFLFGRRTLLLRSANPLPPEIRIFSNSSLFGRVRFRICRHHVFGDMRQNPSRRGGVFVDSKERKNETRTKKPKRWNILDSER